MSFCKPPKYNTLPPRGPFPAPKYNTRYIWGFTSSDNAKNVMASRSMLKPEAKKAREFPLQHYKKGVFFSVLVCIFMHV